MVECAIPVPPNVVAACELRASTPLYVAHAGVMVALVSQQSADATLTAPRGHPLGADAAVIGRVVAEHPGLVSLETAARGSRIVGLLPGDQLPRIC